MNSGFWGNEWCNVESGQRTENLIWNYGQTEWIESLGGWESEVGMVREVSLWLTKKSIIQKLTSQTQSTTPLAALTSPTSAFMACVDGGWIGWLGGWAHEVERMREVSLWLTKKSIIQKYKNSPLKLNLPLHYLHLLLLRWRSRPACVHPQCGCGSRARLSPGAEISTGADWHKK